MLREKVRLLHALMRSTALERGDVAAAVREMTEVAADVLEVDRVGFWRFARRDGAEHQALELVDLFVRSRDTHDGGIVLTAEAAPRYFSAIVEERSIAITDALTDPRTSEFADSYLRPQGIGAMLDAPVMSRGALLGVVCHEHTGGPRKWRAWEELAAGTFADCVALTLDAAEARAQRHALQKAHDNLESLVFLRTEALKQSQDSFRQLFQAAPVAMALTSTIDATVLDANTRAHELFGIAPGAERGMSTADFWSDPDERAAALRRLLRDGVIDGVETRMRGPNGREIWIALSAQRMQHAGAPALLVSFHDITPMKDAEAQLRLMATTDALTGALTRRRFFEIAEAEVERSDRYGNALALAMIDLDHFKQVNDRCGHRGGDEALRHVTKLIKSALRATDHLGRYGGEELAVLLPETTLPPAHDVLERIRGSISSSPATFGERRISLTISAGVAAKQQNESLEALLGRADEALYRAKGAGRNQVVAAS